MAYYLETYPQNAIDVVEFDSMTTLRETDNPATISRDVYYTTDGTLPTTGSTQQGDFFHYAFRLPEETGITINTLCIYNGVEYRNSQYTYFEPSISAPVITIDSDDVVTITPSNTGTTILYTTDGSYPNSGSTEYRQPFTTPFTVKAIEAVTTDKRVQSTVVSASTEYVNYPSPYVILEFPPEEQYPRWSYYNDGVLGYVANPVPATFYVSCPADIIPIAGEETDLELRYTCDGTDPDENSYVAPIPRKVNYIEPKPTILPRFFFYADWLALSGQTYYLPIYPQENGVCDLRVRIYNKATGLFGSIGRYKLYYKVGGMDLTPIRFSIQGTSDNPADATAVAFTGAQTYPWYAGGTPPTAITENPFVIAYSMDSSVEPVSGYSTTKLATETWIFSPSDGVKKYYQARYRKYFPLAMPSDVKSGGSKANGWFSGNGTDITMHAPEILPSGDLFYGDTQSVTMTQDQGYDIYYTTDGSNPTTGSTKYSHAITISGTTNFKASAYRSDLWLFSEIRTKSYSKGELTTTITPATSTFPTSVSSLTVNITNSEVGTRTTYYTTDGTAPTTGSTVYSAPFNVSVSIQNHVTVKALTVFTISGETFNKTDEATYTVQPQTPTPYFYPETGTYDNGVTVEIACEDGSSEIYYTIDGSTPTTGSTRYRGGIYVNSTATVKAIAYDADYTFPVSEVGQASYNITTPEKSHKARRASDNNNGIYVKNVTYSGIPTNLRAAYVLPSAITVTDTEADVTWGYHVDNVDEDLGDYGTRCHVNDTSITVHVEFTHGGKKYTLEKEIPCTCVVQDAVDTTDTIDIIEAHAIVTLENQLRVVVKARVKHTEEETVYIVSNLSNYSLSGSCDNGNFMCEKEGSYFVYDDILTLNYSGQTHQANDVELTLLNSNGNELDHHVIQVTFQAGSIFDVRDDAIRMAVQSAITYTDGEISGVTNKISQLEINISGITGTVSSITNTVSGISADVSQLQQTASSLTSEIYNISGDMVTHSELGQTASAITAYVFDEFGDMTGLDISGGTITLHADQTIIDGQLSIKDGISFKDESGSPVTTIDGTDIGAYSSHTNGTLTYTNDGGGFRSDAIDYSVTGNWFSVGNYKSGDTISIQEIGLSSYFYLQGSSVPIYNTANSVSLQIQAKKNDDSEPFFTQSLTINKDSDRYYKITGVPIIQITVPADNSLVKLKYVLTSATSAGGVGTAGFGTWTKYGATINTHSHLGKSGLIIDHSANYTTYIGAEDFKIRKESCGFGFGRYGNSTYSKFTPLVSTMGFGYYNPSSGSFPDNPDKQNNTLQYAWIPQDNFIPHTNIRQAVTGGDQSAIGAVCQYGTVTGYSEYGDQNYLKLDERNIVGEVWLDSVQDSSYSELGRFAILLPPPYRQVILGNQTAIYHLPAGYRVRIRNLRNDWALHQWYVWGNESDAPSGYNFPIKFFTDSGVERSLFISHLNGYVDLIFAGVRYNMNQDGNPGYQEWYVTNINA